METSELVARILASDGSYRTYEEWKQIIIAVWEFVVYLVLTVPMRNGNRPRILGIQVCPIVLTVPMRNGNTQQLAEF